MRIVYRILYKMRLAGNGAKSIASKQMFRIPNQKQPMISQKKEMSKVGYRTSSFVKNKDDQKTSVVAERAAKTASKFPKIKTPANVAKLEDPKKIQTNRKAIVATENRGGQQSKYVPGFYVMKQETANINSKRPQLSIEDFEDKKIVKQEKVESFKQQANKEKKMVKQENVKNYDPQINEDKKIVKQEKVEILKPQANADKKIAKNPDLQINEDKKIVKQEKMESFNPQVKKEEESVEKTKNTNTTLVGTTKQNVQVPDLKIGNDKEKSNISAQESTGLSNKATLTSSTIASSTKPDPQSTSPAVTKTVESSPAKTFPSYSSYYGPDGERQAYFKKSDIITNKGKVGLRNMGNTCYMNAVLQCLLHTPHLLKAALSEQFDKETVRTSRCTDTLKDLLLKFANNTSAYEYERPSELRYEIGRLYSQFTDYDQQDSFEFLLLFMDAINNEMNRVKVKPGYSILGQDSKDYNKLSEKWYAYSKSREDSIITDIFRGQTMSTVKCSCDFEHITFEDYLALTLQIPRAAIKLTHSNTLAQCLDEYTKKETIQDDFFCASCNSKNTCQKQTVIWRFPPVLILQLKRFYVSTWKKEKLDTLIEFPYTLDLSKYKGESGHKSAQEPVYQLYGIIHHSGGLNFGHYTAECYNIFDRNWYDFNDSSVSSMTSVKESSSTAYVLFYIRKDELDRLHSYF